jgi:hypothetical protein
MKKIIFLLFLPLLGLGGFSSALASVTVTPLGVDYVAKKVTFKVAWTGSAANNRAWVWIDLCPVSGVTPSTFQTAVISTVSVTGGSVDAASLNGRGFYVTTNPSTITATLSNAVGKFNWCAYGSNFPPNVMASNGTYTLRGTPPFILKDAGGAIQIVQGKTTLTSSLTIVPITMTDATGCPSYFCPYVGDDLYFNTTYKCQQRTSGAGNWEAYIKDIRDNIIYKIVQFSDGSWWFAEDLQTVLKRRTICSGYSLYNPEDPPACPAGWDIPTAAQVRSRWTDPRLTDDYGGACEASPFWNGGCPTGTGKCMSEPTTNWCSIVVNGCGNPFQYYVPVGGWQHWCGASSGLGCMPLGTTSYDNKGARVRCRR